MCKHSKNQMLLYMVLLFLSTHLLSFYFRFVPPKTIIFLIYSANNVNNATYVLNWHKYHENDTAEVALKTNWEDKILRLLILPFSL